MNTNILLKGILLLLMLILGISIGFLLDVEGKNTQARSFAIDAIETYCPLALGSQYVQESIDQNRWEDYDIDEALRSLNTTKE